MATTEKEITDLLWEEMKMFATEQQQCFYELLADPDWTIYKSDKHKYLKQNIGYAIYGSPESTKDAKKEEPSSCYYETKNSNDMDDVADTVKYNNQAKKVIDKIYEQICKCTIETDDTEQIYFSIIFNLIFRSKTNVKPKKEVKKKVKKEAKAEIKEKAKEDKKELLIVNPVPIFKIRKSVQNNFKTTKSIEQENTPIADEIQYETWYIDTNARVYKTWADYKKNNNLPQCTMVVPKDGFYQADPDYPITEEYSTVWLEIMDSPACTWKAKICNGIDIASSVIGIGTVGLGVASLLTPLAPVVIVSGIAATGVTSAWTLGRNSQHLVDRSSHKESVHLFNKEAFPHYLGIAGTTFGLGAVGGSVIISNVAARGMTVNTFAKVAFDTVQRGNLFLNGVGMLYQGYYMIDKYITGETVTVGDALNLATHIMFFCGSIVKVQFANEIIESTQGKVINDYKESLSSKRLRKKYNRVVRNAAENNVSKISENADVISYITKSKELLSNQPAANSSNQILNNRNIVWSCKGGRLRVNGIVLLDPVEYVTRLIKLGIFIEVNQNNSSGPQNHTNDAVADQLLQVFCNLLSRYYDSDDCPRTKNLPIVPDFEPLIREMSSMHINEDYLKMLFKITEKLMKRSRSMDDFLFQTFTFVWQYCKANLRQWGMSLCYYTQSISSSKILQKIIIAIFEAIDVVLNNLFCAFGMYIDSNMDR
ncbi:uncharacterized protein LOC105832085 isoform X1 [Monomorium pharaonis]|uniref:uncharacterized protein LOC105832085 isoform X1 n=2 Tax=Monomorium pharaonis TaxID=307658 RepID=UPI0017463BB6|nr:uncharacterized protein LOC105832085 isoform X1 [Monomorium pharaonis]